MQTILQVSILGKKTRKCFTLEPVSDIGFSATYVDVLDDKSCLNYVNLKNIPEYITIRNIICAVPQGKKSLFDFRSKNEDSIQYLIPKNQGEVIKALMIRQEGAYRFAIPRPSNCPTI